MGISFLSLLTSEIIYSYLTRKIYLDILFNTTFFDYFSHNDYDIKIETYRQSGFSGIRKFSKMTGFEQYRRSLNQKNSAHSSVLSGKDYYDENYRRPMEMIVKDPGYKCVPLVNYERLYQIYLENPKA